MPAPIHASCFALNGGGCVLVGPSGSGKSQLLAQMLALGCTLVADDQVLLTPHHAQLLASPVPELAGVMELRGLGLVRRDHARDVPVQLVVQLGEAGERLPPPAQWEHAGITLPLLRLDAAHPGTAAKLLCYVQAMQEQRILPQDWRP